MAAIVLSLLAAVVYGVGDYVGGLATRRAPALFVVGVGQVVGLFGLAAAAWALGAPDVRSADLWWGGSAGLATVVGITLLYQGLATGRMSVVAPVTALVALAVPVLFALVVGRLPGVLAGAGIALAAFAVALISREPDRGGTVVGARAPLLLAVGAGAGIGAFYILMDPTGPGSGLWPLVAARAVSVMLFALVAVGVLLRRRRAVPPPGDLWLMAAGAGVCDAAANALYLLASREGALAVVVTLTSLYPASTVLLARLLLKERLRPAQLVGLALATVAVAMIVVGR